MLKELATGGDEINTSLLAQNQMLDDFRRQNPGRQLLAAYPPF